MRFGIGLPDDNKKRRIKTGLHRGDRWRFDSFFGTNPKQARVKTLIMQGRPKAFTLRFLAFLITLIAGLSVGLVRHIYEHRQGMFTSAAFMGHRFQMKAAYALGIDVNAAACEFRSCFNAVWGAAYGGYDDEIQFLVERGADVDASPAKFRSTALMVASYKGNESTVRLLLSHGSDPNAMVEGETALSYAKQKGHLEIVRLLEQAGAIECP